MRIRGPVVPVPGVGVRSGAGRSRTRSAALQAWFAGIVATQSGVAALLNQSVTLYLLSLLLMVLGRPAGRR
jgi:hypothetical protein